jgi:hypothetical protein
MTNLFVALCAIGGELLSVAGVLLGCVIGRRVRTLIQRHRNHRWVRALRLARPACAPIGQAEPTPSQTTPGAAVRAPAASGVPHGERWRVQL